MQVIKWTKLVDYKEQATKMIVRALCLALLCAYTAALAPLTPGNDDSDCALYLSGPGRSSAYDYSINLLKGNFGYDGQQTCITYDAINQAYLEGRNRILVSHPKGDWKAEDFGSVGELMLDISINLARRYGLTYEEVEKGLPLIDTSRTLIREVCPPVFSHVECRAGKYRRYDGLCNNLQHPTWGATMAPFQRLIGPLFSDGINAPRISHTGHDLPLSRVVSRTMHPDDGFHDHAGTVMVIAWGQFMDHDYTLTGTPLDPLNRNDPEECCKRPPHLKHPYCNEIRIPDDDYFYRLFGVKCIDFVRAFPSPRPGCRLGSRVPFNTLTGSLDGNTVYGVTDKFARKLRTGFGGLLRMNPVFKEYGLKDLLPLKLDIPDEGCTRPNKNMYCFEAGEIRVNEQLVLTVMHTLMAREHNRVANALAEVNPHWDDETLFQEARRINIAEIQHITYNEFLPILLGKDVMEKFGLVLEKEGYWNGYDPEVNPDVIASFASAAYRFGHSLLPTAVERWSKAHKFIASKRLSDLIRRPYDLYRAGVFDEYVMGLMNQVAQAMDDSITQEVTNHLFKKVGARFGMDLVSFNMQRGREFGIPGYMEFRKFCGLPGADSFQDLFGSMSNHTVQKYETIFEHPVDVDLWSGGVSERPLPGSMLGPTFACIIATQFSYSRRGDRFWFELPHQPSSFTPEQLAEIRKSRLARVICDNTDIIDTVQLYPMVLPDHELNPRVPCRSGIIPGMDFSKWAEPAPFRGQAKQYITDAYIPENNNTNEEGEKQIENITNVTNCLNLNGTKDILHACNAAELIKAPVQKQNCNLVNPILNISDCSNIIINGIMVKKENCSTNSQQTDNNCNDNKIPSEDTILKYLNKNSDKLNDDLKTKGHIANSLKRKRRTTGRLYESNQNGVEKTPLIVNYETEHSPGNADELPERITNKNIKTSNIPDYNPESSHRGRNRFNRPDYSHDKPRRYLNNRRQRERYTKRKSNEEPSYQNDESEERRNEKNQSEESKEPYRNHRADSSYEPSSESSENETENKGDKRKHYINDNGSLESEESVPNNRNLLKLEQSSDNNDSAGNRPSDSYDDYRTKSIKNKNSKLQDSDPDDFRYENIQVNDKGEVEVADDKANDSYSTKSPHSSNNNNNVEKYNKLQSLSQENIDVDTDGSSAEGSNESNQPINVNNGEVKPVVEINNYSDSRENSNENTREAFNSNDDGEGKSLKTVSDVGLNLETKKASTQKNSEEGDVKQQFERIPLNYNHETNEKNANVETEEKPVNINSNKHTNNKEVENDGTIDTLTPKENNYDENLNIKFDDLSIKLPEIKLPDDILSYAYEEPTYSYGKRKDKDEQNTYKNNHKDSGNSEPKKNEANKNSNDNGYYGYYSDDEKQDYKKKNKDDEYDDEDYADDVDLYEKFVRERFGKKDSFEKRSERLQDINSRPQDPQLYKTIKNILKKTEDVKKEAEKSGDPKAGYAWTLEYGENV